MKKICIKKIIFENDLYGLIPGVCKVRPAGQQACYGQANERVLCVWPAGHTLPIPALYETLGVCLWARLSNSQYFRKCLLIIVKHIEI